ncbi:hypothetical protein BH24ACT5_BH24ACT5_32310 [soil metagenome]
MSEPVMESPTPVRTAVAGRPRSRFLAIVRYTLRSCLPPKRLIAVALACVATILLGLLARVIDDTAVRAFAQVAADAVFGLTVPAASLMIGDAVLGAEIRRGTFHFTWLLPAPAGLIVLGRWVGGCIVALATITPACAVAAVVAGAPSAVPAALVAAAVGSCSYVAIFIAIGCLTQRTASWSLAFVFLIERLLGAALTGIAQLSPSWESRAIFVGLLDDEAPRSLVRTGIPDGSGAIVRLAIVSAVALGIAVWRMGHLRLSGAAD